jgi:hypothetical protein
VSDEKISLTAALRHLTQQERRTASEHATPGELTAYHEGTLPPPIEERVREHLAHCRVCSDLLLDLAGFADLAPPPGVPELTDAEVEEDWQALRVRLGEGVQERERATVVPFRPPAPAPVRLSREALAWKMAAAAMIVATVMSAWVFTLRKELQSSKEFQSSVVVLDQGEARRGESILKNLSSHDINIFRFFPSKSYKGYLGEILQDQNVVWKKTFKATHISASAESGIDPLSFSFGVPPETLKPGTYVARLYGITEGRRERIGESTFAVDAP